MIAFSYSGDPSTSRRDEVRFAVQDTDSTCVLLTDAEIDYLLAKWMPLYQSALFCASIAAAQISRKWAGTVNVSDGSSSAAVGDLQARYAAMATQLRAEYELEGDVGGLANLDNILANFAHDASIAPLEFGMNLEDNLRAGNQNWGGYADDPASSLYDVASDGVYGGGLTL